VSKREREFEEFVGMLGLRFFKAHEIGFLGGAHYARGKAQGLNALPHKNLWPNIAAAARAADEIRARLGSPVIILSGYRSPAYNKAIGGASRSRHMAFDALDLAAPQAGTHRLLAAARAVRQAGHFTGGIGSYPGFVHIDNRGANVDF
jgi:hypothetical protein